MNGMPDREKVIKDLHDIAGFIARRVGIEQARNFLRTIDEAIALLKEQEAVTIKKTKEHGFGVYGGICPKCRNWIQSAHSFCGFCGQGVKWE